MNIRQLEAFRAFMIARSTVGAAELMQMTQPAVSRLLNQLEASLRLTLFDRSSGRLVPTQEALLLYTEVERTFVSVDKILEMARDIRAAHAGSLTIASLPLLALGFLPDVIRSFSETHPQTQVSLNVEMSARIADLVATQQIDLGFAEFPFEAAAFDRSGIVVEEFCRVPYLLVVPAGHRLAGRDVVTPRDLAGERFVSLTRNAVGRMQLDRLFDQHGVARQLVMDSQVVAVVAKLVAEGLGIGLIDPFTFADSEGRGIVPIRFEPAVQLRLGLIYPALRPMSRIAREFLPLLRRRRHELLARLEPYLGASV
jgi:DNA-binding transcriptional LysR family regulator